MAELIAVGKNQQHRSWTSIPEQQTILLGRAPRHGLSVPWDPLISREHAHLRLDSGVLTVSELATARNPILLGGKPTKEFAVQSAGEFVIGETRFRFDAGEDPAADRHAIAEHLLGGAGAVVRFENASACLEALCKMPALIAKTRTDADFAAQVVDLLLASLPGCLAAAVVQFQGDGALDSDAEPMLIRWNSRGDAVQRFRPSRRLMRRALDQQQSVVHLWTDDGRGEECTMSSDLDWAFCTPIPTLGDDRWCLYVSGRRHFQGVKDIQSPGDLIAELRLAELTAQFIGAIRQVRTLEHMHSEMRQFFSPAVVETLSGLQGSSKLEPRKGVVSVMFCDVRGFSKKVEESSDDLHAVLARVREALSVMTRAIMKYDGVIADFQGDAALAFWGWPTPSDESPVLACRTALAIHNAFVAAQQNAEHPLHGFHVGIGVGYGEAIAGRIGADEQIKVGVFGPVVNLASRLQTLTKCVGASIIVDGPTAAALEGALPRQEGVCRRIARVRPAGMDAAVEMFALSSGEAGPAPTDADIRYLNMAARSFESGDWSEARRLLQPLSASDGPANFLRQALAELGETPPANWDGVLPAHDLGATWDSAAETA